MSEPHLGTVIYAEGDTVTVAFERSEMCASCGACRSDGNRKMLLTLDNTAGAEVGDRISITASNGKVAKASLLAYLFPLILLLVGIFIGSRISDLFAIVFGLGFCAAAYGILRLLEKKWKRAFALEIKRVIKKEDITDDQGTDE